MRAESGWDEADGGYGGGGGGWWWDGRPWTKGGWQKGEA